MPVGNMKYAGDFYRGILLKQDAGDGREAFDIYVRLQQIKGNYDAN